MTQLVIIRGCPGSGKTTYAREHYPSYKCFAADDFFEKNGKYIFNPRLLSEAHEYCFERTTTALLNKENVVVTNTFVTLRDLQQYLNLSRMAEIKVICLKSMYGSIHNVPLFKIQMMKRDMEKYSNEIVIYGNTVQRDMEDQIKIIPKMNLEKMLHILNENINDSKGSNEEILMTLNLPLSRLVKDYMEQIKDETKLWFQSFPMKYTSQEAFTKPMLGILYLLEKNDEVRTELGANYCNNLAKIIHKTWKEDKNSLLQCRIELKEASSDKTINLSNAAYLDLERENKELRVHIEELDKTINLSNAANLDLEGENKELRVHIEELDKQVKKLHSTIDTMQFEQETLLQSNEKLIKSNERLEKDKNISLDKINKLKAVFIECMKGKGTSDVEISIYDKLLFAW